MKNLKDLTKKQKIIAATTAATVAVASIGGGTYAYYKHTHNHANEEEVATATEVKAGTLNINVSANEGWTDTSTPAIVRISGILDDEITENDNVNFYTAIMPDADSENHGSTTLTLPIGDYIVDFISPLNTDGSAYTIKAPEESEVVTVKETPVATETDTTETTDDTTTTDDTVTTDETVTTEETATETVDTTIDQEIERVPAEEVTDEMLQTIVDGVHQAILNGDNTLKGDAGTAILDKLNTNVAANPNVSETTTQGMTENKPAVSEVAKPAANGTSVPTPAKPTSKPSSKPATSTPTTGTATEESKPTWVGVGNGCKHNWIDCPAQTKTVTKYRTETYTENVTKTREVPYTEEVTKYMTVDKVQCGGTEMKTLDGQTIGSPCGQEFDTPEEWNDHCSIAHLEEMRQGFLCFWQYAFHKVPYTETVTKYRTETYTEPVTKTREVPYTETVKISKDAVKCSKCGAVQLME